MEDSIRYSWTQFYELNVLAEDRILCNSQDLF